MDRDKYNYKFYGLHSNNLNSLQLKLFCLINNICYDSLGKILQLSRLDAFLRVSKSFNATFVYVELLQLNLLIHYDMAWNQLRVNKSTALELPMHFDSCRSFR
jgi:hypothetical protein